ncbi:MAG: hypothetical protein K2Q10_02645, partial [Rhodospirillales bacterium]|nr:hypothetical protein [Rhodospirillales bacterium]
AVLAVGTSMVPAGLCQGYLCFCSPHDQPLAGDAVFIERMDGKASIKLFLSAGPEWVNVKGWLDADPNGHQEPYFEDIKRTQIKRLAPVIYVKRKL